MASKTAEQEADQEQPERRVGREGSRWWNQQPTSEEVADWFKDIPLHEGMEHDRYIGGIVLIEQTIKVTELEGFYDNGRPKISENKIPHLTFTPYPKVETRVQYWHDLMLAHPEWVGIIEPMGGEPGLPPGFSARTVPHADRQGKAVQTRFLVCSMRCIVYERESFSERVIEDRKGGFKIVRTGKTVIAGAPGTKMVPLLEYSDKVDPNSVMKAETGAVGRALGMAGMLVVPGAGVATAEDMNEAARLEGATSVADSSGAVLPADPTLPGDQAPTTEPEGERGLEKSEDEVLRERAVIVINELRDNHPAALEQLQEWTAGRGIKNLMDQTGPTLKGVVRKAEKILDEAKNAPPPEPTPDPEPEPPAE